MRFLGFENDFVLEWRGASVSIAEANGLSSVSTSRPLLTIFIRKAKNRGDPESRLLLVAPGTFFFPASVSVFSTWMGAEVSFTQVQTSGIACDQSEDEKLELASTKTQVYKRQKRFFKRFWMQDLTQIHSRMHPLVSKESDLQRRTTPGKSETVTKSERLKQSLAAALRLASKKALLQKKLSPTSLKDNAEALTTSSFPIPSFTKKKKPRTHKSKP
jgi:hypothetical protein